MRSSLWVLRCIVATAIFIQLSGCASRNNNPNHETAGVPVVLLEIPRWSVELADRPDGAGGDSAFVHYSGSLREIYPINATRFLNGIKDRLISKHRVDLSENFPEHGYIVVELKGQEIEWVHSTEEFLIYTSNAGESSRTPERVEEKDGVKSKVHSANVYFYDSNRKFLWKTTVLDAKKPKQVADAIAKLLRRPSRP